MSSNGRFSNIILYLIIIAIVAGFLLGHYAPESAVKFKFLGDIFLHALFMMVVPLIVASMVTGIARLGELKNLGTLGSRTLVYYMSTTAISVVIGIILVNIIQPGKSIAKSEDNYPEASYTIQARQISDGSIFTLTGSGDQFLSTDYTNRFELILLDQNIKGELDQSGTMTSTSVPVKHWLDSGGNIVDPETSGTGVFIRMKEKKFSFIDVLVGLIPRNLFQAMANNNILPLIVFSLIFGGILTTLGAKGKLVIDMFEGLNEAFLKIIRLIMYFAPIGIFGLIAARLGKAELGQVGGFATELLRMGKYFLTVVIGLTLHALLVLTPAIRLFAKRKISEYAGNVMPALITAFSTASSSATLPVTIESVKEKNKVSSKVTSFVLPLGATINMDGTALYEAVAAIFIAQVYGIPLDFGAQVVIFLTATLAAIGAAGIPEAGLVTMVIVLKAVGLPTEGIAMILAIDWFLDRFRTTVNVYGDAVGAAIVDRWENKSKY